MRSRTICPKCSPGRKKGNDRCMATDGDLFYCHHCGYSGRKGDKGMSENNRNTEYQQKKTILSLPSTGLPEWRAPHKLNHK